MGITRWGGGVLVTVLAALVAAAPAAGFERVGDRKILVFAGRQEVPTIDPSVKYDWSIRMAQQSLYDALVKYVGNPPEIVSWLAERWESSPDARTWTFHLVKTAKFHNGDPVTAEAVRFSFARTLRLNQGPAWMLSDFLKEDGIAVLDAHTIRFQLTKPYAPFLSFLPWWYVMNPKQVLAHEEGGDAGRKWLTTNEAGSGPFRIKRWQQGVLYELEAVDDYWKGWPSRDHIGGVVYKIVRESGAQRAALLRGEADIVEGLSPDDYDQVGKMPGIVVPTFPGMTTFGLKMNTQRGVTKDPNLRKAIAYAFDYDALIKIYNGNAVLQTSPFPNATRGHIDVPGFPRQDLAKARAFLARSAYPQGGVEIEYVYVQGLEEERKIGLVLIDNLQKLGIKVKMVPLIWPNMVARGAKLETAPDLMAVFTTPVSTDPDAVAYQYHKSSWGKYYGSSHYANDGVWALIDKARTLGRWEDRAPLYAEIQKRITADAPELFGMLANRRWGMRDYVKGFAFSPVRFTGEVDLYPLAIVAK
ncbi:MAG: peptide ABC transporter substrate-binding protein [Candidatus Rokubacteria bacterium RIFCSPHIGHO2_12_FULL_73_22]|nr:MAG: peptide ABC transporter substrate-binding protein [Candidatus Rokubacteria bacterium RIFCSPHIGHO2_02_FULL_73_26]OGK99595.1 MAG: peptide ABC transporter substrate-binding protein [Candidatus Rokubacteria bacterium RIFCSPHIGHO2_12_FULL_73_22]OGL10372.1 MAG: peptide ABC transporter substrate-binding protein [Candidatus Rokubacteria bacterium RIFCSPLOWO2_02_FULL_73_56]OGL21705.1 MAG: peptide ABC transporter substrate-binding protein [Candidatus Rokubacteria bacterium RIFCSPLOWO2_12_FULL_73_4